MINIPQAQTPGFTISRQESKPSSINELSRKNILIEISSDFTSEVIEYMLTNHIPFYLSFNRTSPSDTKLGNTDNVSVANQAYRKEENNILENLAGISNQVDERAKSKDTTVEAIYQKYLEKGIAMPPPKEDQIAAEFKIPLVRLQNSFKTTYGKPFYQLYMEKRMEYAAKLLKKGYRANKVSMMVGYAEKSCIKFNKMFQKHFGVTPKKYQMSQK
jgi:AraC-like DNA-binding protein